MNSFALPFCVPVQVAKQVSQMCEEQFLSLTGLVSGGGELACLKGESLHCLVLHFYHTVFPAKRAPFVWLMGKRTEEQGNSVLALTFNFDPS